MSQKYNLTEKDKRWLEKLEEESQRLFEHPNNNSFCFEQRKSFLFFSWTEKVLHRFRLVHTTPKGMIAVCDQCGRVSKEVFD